jgi:hypothetical protein
MFNSVKITGMDHPCHAGKATTNGELPRDALRILLEVEFCFTISRSRPIKQKEPCLTCWRSVL